MLRVLYSDEQQRALLESRYATALGRLVEQAAEVATSQAPPPGLEHALALILNIVSELGGFSAGRPPGAYLLCIREPYTVNLGADGDV
jgi:hypothetical protein